MESSSEATKVLAIFKEAGFTGFATTDPEKLKAKIREWNRVGVECTYQGQKRRAHPEVCKWHHEKQDPQCRGCRPGESKHSGMSTEGFSLHSRRKDL